jgi:hypothetical protein
MRRQLSGRGLGQACMFVLAIALVVGTVLLGGRGATTWVVISVVLAALLLFGRLGPKPPPPDVVDPQIPIDPPLAARRLVELLEAAQPLPILRGQVRIKKQEVYDLVTAIRGAAEVPVHENSRRGVLEAAEAVEDAAYHAKPVPMTDDVRLPRARVHALIQSLRATGA